MAKIKRQKRRKKYQYHVNRSRINKRHASSVCSNSLGMNKISSENFRRVGLVFDVNKDIKIMNKQTDSNEIKNDLPLRGSKIVECTTVELKPTRKKPCRMSKYQMQYLDYLLNKYGDDYKSMAKDSRNYLQETWKRLRFKIQIYKEILQNGLKGEENFK